MAQRKGLGRGLAALIPTARPKELASEQKTSREQKEEETDSKKSSQEESKKTSRKERTPSTKRRSASRKKTTASQHKEETDNRKETDKREETNKKEETTDQEAMAKSHASSSLNERVSEQVATSQEEAGERTLELLPPLLSLPVDQLEADPDQPRKTFGDQSLEDLTASIQKYGILQPLVVRKYSKPGHAPYRIIAGERRLRAAIDAGLTTVPVLVREDPGEEARLLSVVENVQREDLNPVEEALAYRDIMQEKKLTQQELAQALGKSRPYIANTIRLLQLDADSLQALKEGLLTSSQGRSLLAEKDLKKRANYRKLFIEGKTNVRKQERVSRVKTKNPYMVEVEENLTQSLGTPVSIQTKRKGWELKIACYSQEDLEGLIARLSAQPLEEN